MKITKQYIVTIVVDPTTLQSKYPGYGHNYSSPNEFIQSLTRDIAQDNLSDYGFKVSIEEMKNA